MRRPPRRRRPAAAHGQQHPIKLYLVVWAALFVLSTCSYLVDYFDFHGYVRWFLIVLFMMMKARLDCRDLHAHGLGAARPGDGHSASARGGVGLDGDDGRRGELHEPFATDIFRRGAIERFRANRAPVRVRKARQNNLATRSASEFPRGADGVVMKLDRRSAPAIAMVFAALLIVTLVFSAAWILVARLD